jgi:hypothetical protein
MNPVKVVEDIVMPITALRCRSMSSVLIALTYYE